jgi:hypothetical protein
MMATVTQSLGAVAPLPSAKAGRTLAERLRKRRRVELDGHLI